MHRRWVRSAWGAAICAASWCSPAGAQEIQLSGPLTSAPVRTAHDERYAYRVDAVVGPLRTTSTVFSGAAELGGGASLALRLPTAVTFSGPTTGPALGNLALEGLVSSTNAARRGWYVVASYAVVLPTATADSDRLREAILSDASRARGGEDLALFTPWRAGAVPRLMVAYEGYRRRLLASAQLKAGLLGDTTGSAPLEHLYVAIPEARLAWRFGDEGTGPLCHVVAGLRAWATYATGERRRTYVEPELTATFGSTRLSAGAILDTSSTLTGVRLAISGVLHDPLPSEGRPTRAVDLRP